MFIRCCHVIRRKIIYCTLITRTNQSHFTPSGRVALVVNVCNKMGEPEVQLSEGKIRGVIGKKLCGKTIYKFLGVPYGEPPVGDLRFKAPKPVRPWKGVRDATKDGNPSIHRNPSHKGNTVKGNEDCLVLNVFTCNITPNDKLKPVLFYIHGGYYTINCNESNIYGPEFLLMEDVVIVVINYRLGLLGFLSLEDESLDVPGNAGLKDQRLALQWVQKNIKAFGGDPKNVTIFGESAGGALVHFHVLSESSKGLFHKAIMQSGFALCPWALVPTTGRILAEAMGKKDATERELFNTLNKMSSEEILAVQEKIPDPIIFGSQRPIGPVVEKQNPSAFLTRYPFEVLSSGEYNHVPILIGYTSNEGIIMEFLIRLNPELDKQYTYKSTIPWFMKATGEQADKIEELITHFYSEVEEYKRKRMVYMDSTFLAAIVPTIIHHAKTSKCPVYVYRISVDCQRNFIKQTRNMKEFDGTSHADELGFLWNIQALPEPKENTLEFSTVQRFVKLWTNFAATGNPTPFNDFGITLAPTKNGRNVTVLDIGTDLILFKDFPERERIDLWKTIFSLSQVTVNYFKD